MTETYQCAMCGKDVPWLDGAADDEPELCDRCYGIKKVTSLLYTDALAHHDRDTTVRLRVTTKELGVREFEWSGRFAEQTAKFYTSLWEREGHKVERF